MTTVHIAAAPERGVQRCFRCDRILTDNRRVMTAHGSGGLAWWETGTYLGVTHDTFPVLSIAREVDADPNDPEECQCECPDADVGQRPVAVYQ